jgi:hypothetical protein
MLGGPEHTTVFLLAAGWRGIKHVNEAVAARTGQVLVMQAPVPARACRDQPMRPVAWLLAGESRWARWPVRSPLPWTALNCPR